MAKQTTEVSAPAVSGSAASSVASSPGSSHPRSSRLVSSHEVKIADCDINELRHITASETTSQHVPLAGEIDKGIPVYCGKTINAKINDPEFIDALMSEWNYVFDEGAGIIAIKEAFPDASIVHDTTRVLQEIIAAEAAKSSGSGDHFAAAGANSRVWNSHEKLAVTNPEVFARYYANPVMHLASRAWLGPGYQITAQVNVVHPGGKAQVCHRDYHLGFQSVEQLGQYPRNVHRLSPHLTLQGAIAHSSMPIASGPTQLLPHSQKFLAGYVATQLDEFRQHFVDHHVQLPLDVGDMLFFNPAVIHAAGDNNTEQDRFANLFQIGSAFGRTLEMVDRTKLCRLLYPVLHQWSALKRHTQQQIDDVLAATAEGYPFPCSLDLSPPVGGLAPQSQYDIMRSALLAKQSIADFNTTVDQWLSMQGSM